MENELLPCPFCDAAAKIVFSDDHNFWGPLCNHKNGCLIHAFDFFAYADKKKAIQDWNRRAVVNDSLTTCKDDLQVDRPQPDIKPDAGTKLAGTLPEEQRTIQPEMTGSPSVDREGRLNNSTDAAEVLAYLNKHGANIVVSDSSSASGYSTFHYVHWQTILAALQNAGVQVPEGVVLAAHIENTAERLFEHDKESDFQGVAINNGWVWPEHEQDDGYRGNGGYVSLAPRDIVERYRDRARAVIAAAPTPNAMRRVCVKRNNS